MTEQGPPRHLPEFTGDAAVYLPALGKSFVDTVSSCIYDLRGGDYPASFNHLSVLNFLDDVFGYFFYPNALYSAGVADLQSMPAILENRDRSRTRLICDSGGYSVGSDNLKADPLTILRWMEQVGDIGATLDIPTWVIGDNSKYESFGDCLSPTIEYLKIFQKEHKTDMLFLNCLHGRDEKEIEDWFEEVSKFTFARGYAFGSALTANLYQALRMLIKLRDNQTLESVPWIHWFGRGDGATYVALTFIQRIIRKSINPEITLSFDASSASRKMYSWGSIDSYWLPSGGKNPVRLETENAEKRLRGVDPELPYPNAASPVMRSVCVGDIFHDDKIDRLGSAIIAAHNIYVHLWSHFDALMLAETEHWNRTLLGKPPRNQANELLSVKHIIENVFDASDPYRVLSEHRQPLEAIFR